MTTERQKSPGLSARALKSMKNFFVIKPAALGRLAGSRLSHDGRWRSTLN
jgi:hypothetical protein